MIQLKMKDKDKDKNKKINVLSLFDGVSCARIALDKLGIKVNNYYSSEIDTHAIKVSKKNYPDIINLGDIKKIDLKKLPKIAIEIIWEDLLLSTIGYKDLGSERVTISGDM